MTMVDISSTLVSNSTQLDNVDLMGGARVFTITGVTLNESDQPLHIALAEYDRPWKPGVTMRRLLSEMWGAESDAWVGRRVRLYRDETVTFGKIKPGGTRISHASHIDKPVVVTLPTSKGKFGEFRVQPLTESEPTQGEPTVEHVAACDDPAVLREWWKQSGPERRTQIEARVKELTPATEPTDDPNPQWSEPDA
jgi:hypothetical protein